MSLSSETSKRLSLPACQKNVCCHYCRISKNRKRAKAVRYIKCTLCKNVFCQSCMSTYVLPSFSGNEKPLVGDILSFICLCCRNECCCMFEHCPKDHTHCYTYRRTERRHEKANMRRYKKKRQSLFVGVNTLPVSQINVSKSFSDSNSTSVSISATSHSNEDESTGPFESSEEEIELSIKKEEISVKRKLFEDELDPSKLKKLKIDTNKTPISAENSPLLFESTKQRASNNSMYQYPFQQTSYSSPQADKKPENSLTCSPHSAASLPFQPAVQTFNLSPPHERSQWPTQQLQYHAYSQPQGFPTYPRIQPSVQPHQVPSDASNWKVLHILHHNLRKPNAIQFHPSPIQNPPQLAPKVPVRRFEISNSKKAAKRLEFENVANFSTSDAVSNRRKLETLEIALTHEERQKQQQFIQSPQPQREPASPYSSPEKKNSFSKILTRLENQYQQELREKSIPTQKEKFIAPEPLSPSHNLTETQLNEIKLEKPEDAFSAATALLTLTTIPI